MCVVLETGWKNVITSCCWDKLSFKDGRIQWFTGCYKELYFSSLGFAFLWVCLQLFTWSNTRQVSGPLSPELWATEGEIGLAYLINTEWTRIGSAKVAWNTKNISPPCLYVFVRLWLVSTYVCNYLSIPSKHVFIFLHPFLPLSLKFFFFVTENSTHTIVESCTWTLKCWWPAHLTVNT